MKGPVITIIVVLITGLCILIYFNWTQQQTIHLLNQELVKQAQKRYKLQIQKQKLEQQLQQVTSDTVTLQMN